MCSSITWEKPVRKRKNMSARKSRLAMGADKIVAIEPPNIEKPRTFFPPYFIESHPPGIFNL